MNARLFPAPATPSSRCPLRAHWLAALWLLAALLFTVSTVSTTHAAAPFNILSYGADVTGRNWSTTAVQKAIDACTAAGGGTVVFPRAATASAWCRSRTT